MDSGVRPPVKQSKCAFIHMFILVYWEGWGGWSTFEYWGPVVPPICNYGPDLLQQLFVLVYYNIEVRLVKTPASKTAAPLNSFWFIIPLTDCKDVNIQRGNIWSRWQSVFPERHHAVLLGQSSTATHNYLLGYIFTLYPSLYFHPVRSHLFMFITVSHLPRGGWLTCSERTEVGLARSFYSNRGSRGRRLLIHTLIMSQLPDISETITVGGLLCVLNLPKAKLTLLKGVFAHESLACRRFWSHRSIARSTFNQIRSF